MKAFSSQIRLHKWHVDEAQRRLGELLRLAEHLQQDLVRLEEEAVREQELAATSYEASLTFGAYANQVIERRHRLNRSIAEVDSQVVQAREALKDAYAELKKFELASEAAEERARKQRERREQVIQDEVGLQIFRRRVE